jgi:hypothetical protein
MYTYIHNVCNIHICTYIHNVCTHTYTMYVHMHIQVIACTHTYTMYVQIHIEVIATRNTCVCVCVCVCVFYIPYTYMQAQVADQPFIVYISYGIFCLIFSFHRNAMKGENVYADCMVVSRKQRTLWLGSSIHMWKRSRAQRTQPCNRLQCYHLLKILVYI